MGRLSRGWSMAKASFAVLRQHPKLAVLPMISTAMILLVIAAVAASLISRMGSAHSATNSIWTTFTDGHARNIWFYMSVFAVGFVMTTITIFFNVALIHCILRAYAGEAPSIRAGLTAAIGLLPRILGWALVATTVGVVLNALRDVLKNYLGFLGSLLGGLLDFSWVIVTYFVVPVLVAEKVGPITAVKRSASILRSKWGESLAGGARIGLVSALLMLFTALVLVGGFAIVLTHGAAGMAGFGLILIALSVIGGVATMVVTQTLTTIFQAGVFLYATTGHVPAAFDRDLVEGAFKAKA